MKVIIVQSYNKLLVSLKVSKKYGFENVAILCTESFVLICYISKGNFFFICVKVNLFFTILDFVKKVSWHPIFLNNKQINKYIFV